MQRLTAFWGRARVAASSLLVCASEAFAQAPPPIPVIADADRITTSNISSSTSQIAVGFPVFASSGDCTDLQVTINGTVQPLASGLWNCASLSGFALNTIALPITDMVVNFTPALTSGTVTIAGAWHPRNPSVPTASGINRREYEQTYSTLVAMGRELFHNINALYAIGNVPVITNQGANSFYAGPTSGAAALPSFRAMVQADLPAGLGVNESANTFFAGPASGGAALPAFRALSLNDFGTQANNAILAGPTSGGPLAPTWRGLVNGDFPTSGVTAGTYDSLTVNAQGIVTAASNPASLQASPSNPTACTNASSVMMGLAQTMTPNSSGRVLIAISGDLLNAGAANQATFSIRTGTGSAPANGAAATGTLRGTAIVVSNPTASAPDPFSMQAVVTGLTVGTQIWIDMACQTTSGTNTSQPINLSVTAVES